jgi:hypothetical protein
MSEVIERLNCDYLELVDVWQNTRVAWRDSVADDFERRFWEEIDERSREFLKDCRTSCDALSGA